MENSSIFKFKKFKLFLDGAAHKVGTDSILLGSWVNPDDEGEILDIGTGTGVLALMMAQKTSNTKITAIEIDIKSSKCALDNFSNSPWKKRLLCKNLSLSDFTETTKQGQFSTILCNPPFFSSGKISPFEKRAIARHSIQLSSETLISCVLKLLHKEGKFSLVLPVQEAQLFKEKASLKGLYFNMEVAVKPFKTKSVERVLLEFSRKSIFIEKSELVLMERPLKYSNQYWEISKNFYISQVMGK